MGFIDKLKKNQNAVDENEFKPMQGQSQRPMQNGGNSNFNLAPNQQPMQGGVPPMGNGMNMGNQNMPQMPNGQGFAQQPQNMNQQPSPQMPNNFNGEGMQQVPPMPQGTQNMQQVPPMPQGQVGNQQNFQQAPVHNPQQVNNGNQNFNPQPNFNQNIDNQGFANQQNAPFIPKQREMDNQEFDIQAPVQNIGGQMFDKQQNKPNPLAQPKSQSMDKSPNNMPKINVQKSTAAREVDPEYYGKLKPLFNNINISSIHMYGHQLMTYQLKGEDVIGQPIFETEEEYITALNEYINWNSDKNPHYVDINSFRKDQRTFGTFYMKDLSRLHIVVTEDEIYATIAVKRQDGLSLDDLSSKYNMFDDKVKNFIYEAIQANAKIILAGQGGAGKTTFIEACGNLINPRNVTLVAEEYRELLLNRPNVKYVSAGENRPLYKVVAESTKMRIRNLIVGEVIGQEALAMLEAMNTGLDCVLATTHANGAQHALTRLITLACYNPNINPKFVKNLIGENVDMIIFLEEINGQKKLSEIITIERYQEEVDKIIANKIYDYRKGKTTIQHSTSGRLFSKIADYKKRQREIMQ